MKRIFPLLFFIIQVCTVPPAKAQYYTSLGIRAGELTSGICLKHFIGNTNATGYELLASHTTEAKGGWMGKGFFIRQQHIHNSMLRIPIYTVFGFGGHVGYFRKNYFSLKEGHAVYYKDKTYSAGIDMMFGLEWNSRRTPITVGIEAVPYYSLLNPGPEWIDLGVSIRYILNN